MVSVVDLLRAATVAQVFLTAVLESEQLQKVVVKVAMIDMCFIISFIL